jgi:nicotinate-nucleotide adenylyltransferase
MNLGLFGGAFDPPHNGHVAVVRAGKEALGLDRVIELDAADPGHKHVDTSVEVRLALTRLAFPDDEVVVDEHARTVDTLRAHPEWEGAWFLIGADQLEDFPTWKEPGEVLRHVRLGVATRPGHRVVLSDLERMRCFEVEERVTSRDVRTRLEAGEDVSDVIPPAVLGKIERDGLYHRRPSYTQSA